MLNFIFPDNWILSKEVQHWFLWAPEQNCTHTSGVSSSLWPDYWLLPQWEEHLEVPLLYWSNCKFATCY